MNFTKYFFFVLVISSVQHLFAKNELWLQVNNIYGNPMQTDITLYEKSDNQDVGFYEFDKVQSASANIYESHNAGWNVEWSPHDATPNWKPLRASKIYFLVITDKSKANQKYYCKISVPSNPNDLNGNSQGGTTDSIDLDMLYQNGVFVKENNVGTPSNPVITILGQGVWNELWVKVENSFASGNVIIDGEVKPSGTENYFGTVTYPHFVKAIDDQVRSDQAVMKFNYWNRGNDDPTYELQRNIEQNSGIFKAKFDPYFYQIFQNNFIGLGNKGYLKLNSEVKNMPASSKLYKEDIAVKIVAPSQTYNGIRYDFSHWSDDPSASFSRNVLVAENKTYIANYVGRPSNIDRNMSFNT